MPLCTICGQETLFIPQYQQWYCYRCQRYPYMQQAQAAPIYYPQQAYPQPYFPQPMPYVAPMFFQNPPAMAQTEIAAKARINASFMMRQSSDKIISTNWVWVILLFQVILPVSAVISIYAMIQGNGFDINAVGFLLAAILIVLLISIALAISHAILVHKLVQRRDEHFRRDAILRQGMEEYLAALSYGRQIDLNVERWTMNTLHIGATTNDRSAGLWAMLVGLIAIIPIIGIIFLFYSQYFLTKDVQEHDEKQRSFNQYFQAGLMKAGKITQPLIDWPPLPRRDTSAYVILTILTLGLFLPQWWYVNIQDMNTHLKNQTEFENILIKLLQTEG
jgi:hypothetical protein